MRDTEPGVPAVHPDPVGRRRSDDDVESGRHPGHGRPAHGEAERRDELAGRVGAGTPGPAARDRPDLLPDVDPPDLPM